MIDLRSDTVTRPGPAMRAAMAAAEVGDDVFGDDPTVNRLEAAVAERFGFRAGLFLPTGTQSNLVALMAHCQRGDEYIVGQDAHTYKYEGGGAAVLGSIQPQPLTNLPDGSLDLAEVARAIKPDDSHFARTRLLAIENTIGGKVLSLDYHRRAVALCREKGLQLHLDGARVYNACVKLNVAPAELCAGFNSVSVCLSKGLGAPAGSVLVGSAEFIKAARRWRKMVGGGLRQAGILAAAGLFAIDHHVDRLAEDHAHAARLGDGLARIAALKVTPAQTNMVFVQVPATEVAGLGEHLKASGIIAITAPTMRLVTHLDVSAADVDRVVAAFGAYFARSARAKDQVPA
ncbi:MAG: low-specificity L-threonine aldolase [Betaproteobacteria bacterium]|nr:low-specificity L-threonine aldolase [Betaproteobacteria bacterium]